MLGQAERLFELKKLKTGQSRPGSSKIVAFTSGKGGTGKTFVSLNMAYSLVKQNKKILFIDLDSNLSNANIMINVVAQKTIYDYFTGRALLNDLIFEYEPNLHFIFGDSGKTDYPKPKAEQMDHLFDQIRSLEKNYDYIFLDTGAGASDEIISILLNADFCMLITSPEPTAVMDAYVIIKLLSNNNYKGKKLVLVNKCTDPAEGDATYGNLSAAAGHFLNEKLHLIGTLEFDQGVGQAIIAQELLLKKEPGRMISRQIFKISKSLHEFIHMANIHHTNTSAR